MAGISRFDARFQHIAGGCKVSLSGVIDETFDASRFASELEGVSVLDLYHVQRITSFGVREWIRAARDLTSAYSCYVNVRPAVVAQFNMVAGFAARGELVSFFAPYACDACDRQFEHLIDLRRDYQQIRSLTPPVVSCPACKQPAELDDLPDVFFSYAASAPPPSPPPLAEILIDGAPTSVGNVNWKVEKEVEGNLTAIWLSGPLDKRSRLRRVAHGLEGEVVLVTQGITSVDEEGVEELRQLVTEAEVSPMFARVPATLATALIAKPDVLGRARLLSFQFSFECSHCKQQTLIELDAVDLEVAALWGSLKKNCVACGHPLEPTPGVPPLDQAAKLPLRFPSDAIREYLQGHPYGPGREKRNEDKDLWGKYRLIKQIGAGGMAQVFLATQRGPEGFEKKVVLKRIQPHLTTDPTFVSMFLEEAKLAARLSHPNIVQIFDFGKIAGQHYIAMEYVRGWDLHAIVRACRTLKMQFPIHIACRIIADVLAALTAAHRKIDDDGNPLAIVHRDVSPQNVLVSVEGVTKLTDFGIAKAAGSVQVTEPGLVRGKTTHMSPEQIYGRQIDGRADIFAAGTVLWYCITGQSVFERDSQAATLMAVVNDPVPSLITVRPDAPAPLDTILAKALEKSAANRFQTAEEFQMELERFLVAFGNPSGTAQVSSWLRKLIKAAEASGAIALPHGLADHGSKGSDVDSHETTLASRVRRSTSKIEPDEKTPLK